MLVLLPAPAEFYLCLFLLFIVADGAGGVGGKMAGKIASRYAATKVTGMVI